MNDSIDVRPIAGSLGAEVRGLDLREPISDAIARSIEGALVEHMVLFFPQQSLSPQQHIAFADHFGPLDREHPSYLPTLPEHPEVVELRGEDGGRADIWHTDVTISPTPPLGSILNMCELPEYGGDTMWANMALAYDGLSDEMKAYLEGLVAYHDVRATVQRIVRERSVGQHVPGGSDLDDRVKSPDASPVEMPANLPHATHPVIRTHPVTGRKSIFVNPAFTSHILGIPPAESEAILAFLYAHSIQPEYLCRWRWNQGDLGFWDNRCTMHYAIADYGNANRVIQRVTVKGEKPY